MTGPRVDARQALPRGRIGFQTAALFAMPFGLAVGLVAAMGGTSSLVAVLVPAVATLAMGVAGGLLAPTVEPPPGRLPIAACIALGAVAVCIGATCISFVAAASNSNVHGLADLTSQALGAAWLGMTILGLPALVITVPLAFAWAAVVRLSLEGGGREAAVRKA